MIEIDVPRLDSQRLPHRVLDVNGTLALDGELLPEAAKRLASLRASLVIQAAKARLEEEARRKAEEAGKEPAQAQVAERAQTNFTDPESRILQTPDGFQQCYNAQAAVDADSQVVVAQEVSQALPDVQRLRPMLQEIIELNGRAPQELTAAAGYASEANFAALAEAGVYAVIALRR